MRCSRAQLPSLARELEPTAPDVEIAPDIATGPDIDL